MDLQLQDRHVLITGGSKGIGLACALGFLREGEADALAAAGDENVLVLELEIHVKVLVSLRGRGRVD